MENSENSEIPETLKNLVAPHIESFNNFVEYGLSEAVGGITPVEVNDFQKKKHLTLWFERPEISFPHDDKIGKPIFPSQCREGGWTYQGEFRADLMVSTGGGLVHRMAQNCGKMPIMVKSKLCHLKDLTQSQLRKKGEEGLEMGGYFICNGIERIIRLLIQPKRNYPMAVKRASFVQKGAGFTDMGVMIRCTHRDLSSMTNRIIYLQDGSAMLSFSYRKNEYYLPVGIVLKALVESTDNEIFQRLVSIVNDSEKDEKKVQKQSEQEQKGHLGTHYVRDRALLLLSQPKKKNLFSRNQCLSYLGENFRAVFRFPDNKSDAFVGMEVVRQCILIHLDRPQDKFNLLIFMLQKLYSLVDGTAQEDNPDSLQHHDLLLPGEFLTIVVKEKFQMWLRKVSSLLESEIKDKPSFDIYDLSFLQKVFSKVSINIGQTIEYLLNTGNLNSETGLDLQQASGFTIVAEKLNFLRYISHFRSVHRGAYFSQMRTTAVRKLLPESWGFLCPVHTPDGAPCGLLSHLSLSCSVSTETEENGDKRKSSDVLCSVLKILSSCGMIPVASGIPPPGAPSYFSVLLDGCVIGWMERERVEGAVRELRRAKVDEESGVPPDLEVGHVPYSPMGTFPGLFLHATSARMLRPVRQRRGKGEGEGEGKVELIGPFEQAFMEVRCPDGGDGGRSLEGEEGERRATHEEIHPTSILSVVANLTPWSDFNQSPRNMYQCQMGKQTMGTPLQAFPKRADNKLYRLQSPQTPIARTSTYDKYQMDDYPSGTNAIVAVLAYTGYDMEDAMIINKSSMERGFCHGQIYKTETIDLTDKTKKDLKFGRPKGRGKGGKDYKEVVGADGLPYVGQKVGPGEEYLSLINTLSGAPKLEKLKGTESAVVDQVTAVGTGPDTSLSKVNIKMRYGRNPQIGDKFSSRHGQKGVLSQLWPDIDMPFSHISGMRPDIIINPHAFPSRMTIGMLVESMASKGGALQGNFVNATPFRKCVSPPPLLISGPQRNRMLKERDPNSMDLDEDKREVKKKISSKKSGRERDGEGEEEKSLVDEFGRQLAAKGYNYYGTEVMYSGIFGVEMKCEIYMGVVYYQRLRHMVSDKFQVRATGPVNSLTQQPVKGRKFGGGIRFGEMERDALLSHGTAFLLNDRLHKCSDFHVADVCSLCGSMLSPSIEPQTRDPMTLMNLGSQDKVGGRRRVTCHICRTGRGIERVAMPYVFKYLAAELAAMNIKLTLTLKEA